MEKLTLKVQCIKVLGLWKENERRRRDEARKSREARLKLWDRRLRLMILGWTIISLGFPVLYAFSRYAESTPGLTADLIAIALMGVIIVGLAIVLLSGFAFVWPVFARWAEDLFAAAGTWHDRERPFVEDLANDTDLELPLIGRRLKAELEVREKSSAALAIIAGSASFSSLGPVCDALARGKPSFSIALPAMGLAAATILLQTLFISARLKGHLLICLEEAEELRKALRTQDSSPDQQLRESLPTYDNSRLRLEDRAKKAPCVPIAASDTAGESRNGSATL